MQTNSQKAKNSFDEEYARKRASLLLSMRKPFSYILEDMTRLFGRTSLVNVIIAEENEKLIRKGSKTSFSR